jgi:DNA adenine methylase
MLPAIDAPKRPALRYYGGKWKLAPWIISHFPDHKNYVEPCGGAASVLLQKPLSPLETYNDLDGNVVNFFRVLRDNPDELIRKIRLTPWARAEYELSLQPCEDEIERARRFFVASYMSFNGGTGDNPRLFGWRCSTDANLRLTPSADLQNNVLGKISDRLLSVQIENRPYQDILTRFDNKGALIYFDPPYTEQERTNGKEWYNHEFAEKDHIESAGLLRQSIGYAIVSGYACPLYTELYEAHGWHRVDKEAQTNSGGKRTESLWLSPRTVEALQIPKQAALFVM